MTIFSISYIVYVIIEEDDGEDENLVDSSNRSEKTVIKPCTTHIYLNKLGYQYIDIKKGVFFNRYKWPDIVEYRAQFLKELEALSPYLVEFQVDSSIEEKAYPLDCIVNDPNKRPVMLITHNESIFLINDN